MTKQNNPLKIGDIRKAVSFSTVSNTHSVEVRTADESLALTEWSYEEDQNGNPHLVLTAEKEAT